MSAENGGRKTLDDLVAIMAALRTPVTGCPWDLEQDFSTIAPYTIEEAYEVADAIERGDRSDLCEELGDLLLQVVYHARMAEEEGAFTLADVVDGIARKMVRRHPHVFGDEAARSAGAAKGFWEDIKAKEKAARGARTASTTADAGTSPAASLLAEVPTGLPALTRAVKLQSKAARVGFDWPSLGPVFDKMREELAELEAALGGSPSAAHAGIDWKTASPEHREIEAELGDLFFVMANVARHLAIDPEAALRSANAKFARRFAHIERRLAADGRSPAQSDLAEMDRLWDEAKNLERKPETKDEA